MNSVSLFFSSALFDFFLSFLSFDEVENVIFAMKCIVQLVFYGSSSSANGKLVFYASEIIYHGQCK